LAPLWPKRRQADALQGGAQFFYLTESITWREIRAVTAFETDN